MKHWNDRSNCHWNILKQTLEFIWNVLTFLSPNIRKWIGLVIKVTGSTLRFLPRVVQHLKMLPRVEKWKAVILNGLKLSPPMVKGVEWMRSLNRFIFCNFSREWEEFLLQTKFLAVGSSLVHLSIKKKIQIRPTVLALKLDKGRVRGGGVAPSH